MIREIYKNIRAERKFLTRELLQRVTLDPYMHLEFLERGAVVNTLNGYSLAAALTDKDFYKALIDSDILLCDGILVRWLCKKHTDRNVLRVTGPDFADYVFDYFDQNGGQSLLYFGSSEIVCSKLELTLRGRHSNNNVSVCSASYFPEINQIALDEAVAAITNSTPDVIFISMTAPKQEKLAKLLQCKYPEKSFVQVGAYFEFAAGTINRGPKFLRKIGLEWCWRLIKEPRKISKRIWKLRILI